MIDLYTAKTTAVIEKGAVIGSGSFFGHFCVIRNDVVMGKNNVIAHHVTIEPDVIIGDNNTIQVYAAITSHTVIGSNNFIGPYFSTTNCRRIPDGPKGTHPEKKVPVLEKTMIGDNIVIGANCKIAPGLTIGDNSIIGMNCFIKKDVPEGSKLKAGTVYG